MCLVVPEKQYKREILEEDMTVYKLFRSENGKLLSPIFYMEWEEGELYSEEMIAITYAIDDKLYFQIGVGFHSFDHPPLTYLSLFESLQDERYRKAICIKPCIIPKGSVIVRHGGHVVSNMLKLKI